MRRPALTVSVTVVPPLSSHVFGFPGGFHPEVWVSNGAGEIIPWERKSIDPAGWVRTKAFTSYSATAVGLRVGFLKHLLRMVSEAGLPGHASVQLETSARVIDREPVHFMDASILYVKSADARAMATDHPDLLPWISREWNDIDEESSRLEEMMAVWDVMGS